MGGTGRSRQLLVYIGESISFKAGNIYCVIIWCHFIGFEDLAGRDAKTTQNSRDRIEEDGCAFPWYPNNKWKYGIHLNIIVNR